ncbi:MAG: UDP-N-acetylmuramate dehydrogenase [Candidatus Kapaibacterium sp.]|nr:MAG: UDP-N-acetylmuramate dehydrogenase [Candidatus Kapabacteria bacterium]
MIFHQHYSLKPHNSFGLEVFAEQFVSISSEEELREVFRSKQSATPVFVLGGGSNVLFTQNVQGLVCKIALKGTRVVRETAETLELECAAGEVWDDIVRYAVAQNWGGIENLSLIPGSIGAAPVQNIGAYGVELKDVLVSVQGMMRDTGEMHTLTQEECAFGYRDSIFKRELKNKCVITSVTMRLRKNPTANDLHTSYGAIREELTKLFPETPHESYTVHHVSEAVRSIRRSKLPDPAVLGNAGSFFKNPEVSREVYERLYAEYPAMPVFMLDSGLVKIPAAWLIEQTGWKGRRDGDAGMHTQQALVLVNYGKATGQDLVRLSERVRADVFAKFSLQLETEVNIL